MKYNEAIDMILDGGEAHQRSRRDWIYSFYLPENMGVKFLGQRNSDPEGGGPNKTYRFDAQLDEMMVNENDWIVEKDGVVYHEPPPVNVTKCGSPICRDIIRNCYECRRDNQMCAPHNYFRANNKCYDPPECACELKPKEEPREKVTVSGLVNMIFEYIEKCISLKENGYQSEDTHETMKFHDDLKQKLEYLVSLQEK